MKNELIKTEMDVDNKKIGVMRIGNEEYISLTDLARYADEDDPRYPIQNWMRNKDVIAYLGLWEKLNNENFKSVEFDTFEIIEIVKIKGSKINCTFRHLIAHFTLENMQLL